MSKIASISHPYALLIPVPTRADDMDGPDHAEEHPSQIQSPCSPVPTATAAGEFPCADLCFTYVSWADASQ